MNKSQKVVVVTGAYRGICAEVVKSFRKCDYHIVAALKPAKASENDNIFRSSDDIGDPVIHRRVISEGIT